MTQPQTIDSLPASAEPPEEDGHCEQHGPCKVLVLEMPFGGKAMRVRKCAGCTADRLKKDADEAERKRQAEHAEKIRSLYGRAYIPRRFQDRSLSTYHAENAGQKRALLVAQKFVENWAETRRQGTSLILTGGPGTGKTHLACGIAAALIEQHYATVLFLTVLEALRSIKATYNRESEISEQEAIDNLSAPGLLILDEIGVQLGTEHEKMLLFDVLNSRYQECRPTILLSNLSGADLEQYLGQRVMDRYRECGAVLAFDWDSYRGRQ